MSRVRYIIYEYSNQCIWTIPLYTATEKRGRTYYLLIEIEEFVQQPELQLHLLTYQDGQINAFK